MNFYLETNPLQVFQLWRKDSILGLPISAIEFLAMTDPRPIGIILHSVGRLREDSRLDQLSSVDFQDELRFNSGTYIQLLLRRYNNCPDQTAFISIFDSSSKALLCLIKKWKWVAMSVGLFSNAAKTRIVDRVTSEFKSTLQALEVDFVKWATSFQNEIATIYYDTLTSDEFFNGNAMNDYSKGGLQEVLNSVQS